MAMHVQPHRVVILGAGFAGLRVALELEKRRARTKQCEITLIDRNEGHVYWPLLYEVCSGALQNDGRMASVGELGAGVRMRLDRYASILGKKHIHFVHGSVASLDDAKQEVVMEGGKRIAFNDIVVALGAESNTYGIPGVAEYAMPMKSLDDAFHIRARIATFLSGYAHGKEKHISICIGGAGATGTELAAELGNFFGRLVREGMLKPEDYDIVLIEAGPDILGPYSEAFRASARKRLAALGVEVNAGMKILSLDSDRKIHLAGTDGKEQTREADVLVWAGGIKPAEVVANLGLPVDEKGFVVIEPTFEIKGMEHAYALGDCAAVMNAKTGKRVPALGQAAVKEAGIVAENIARHLERKPLMNWTPPEKWITVVPLGGSYALADFGAWHLTGFFAFLIRKAADFLYFFSILPVRTAWKVWAHGASVYHQND